MAATSGKRKRAAAVARSRTRSDTASEKRKKSSEQAVPLPIKGRPKQPDWRLHMQPELIDQSQDLELWLAKPAKPVKTPASPSPVVLAPHKPDTSTPHPHKPAPQPEAQPEPEHVPGSTTDPTGPTAESVSKLTGKSGRKAAPEGTTTTTTAVGPVDSNRPRSESWNLVEGEERTFAEEFGIHPKSWSLNLKLVFALMIMTIITCGFGLAIILPDV